METDPDSDALIRTAAGDRGAFAGLFDRHYASLLRFVQRYVGNPARAEELAQDVFLKLYRNARAYRPTARFKTFLFRVAANHCLNELRRREDLWVQSAPEEVLAVVPAPEGERPDAAVAGRDLERAVGEALARMKPRERAAFLLCRFEGLSYREIAEALETTEPAVKSLMHRATLTLTETIEATCEQDAELKLARSRT